MPTCLPQEAMTCICSVMPLLPMSVPSAHPPMPVFSFTKSTVLAAASATLWPTVFAASVTFSLMFDMREIAIRGRIVVTSTSHTRNMVQKRCQHASGLHRQLLRRWEAVLLTADGGIVLHGGLVQLEMPIGGGRRAAIAQRLHFL